MKQWYNESYFNRNNWILEHIREKNLSTEETVVLLIIEMYNSSRDDITLPALVEASNLDSEKVDAVLNGLCQKGYLSINFTNGRVVYNTDGLFEKKTDLEKISSSLFETFEEQFSRPLTQPETVMLSEWVNTYDEKQIIDALRKALINRKYNFKYIEKILTSSRNETLQQ